MYPHMQVYTGGKNIMIAKSYFHAEWVLWLFLQYNTQLNFAVYNGLVHWSS